MRRLYLLMFILSLAVSIRAQGPGPQPQPVVRVTTDITGASTCVAGKLYYNATSLVNWERNSAGVCAKITSGGTPGNVIGPASATAGDFPLLDATGKVLSDSGKAPSTDGTFGSNSDAKVPTEKAVKTYADTKAPIDNPAFTTQVKSPIFVTNASDPADGSAVRLGNNEFVAWEKFVAGTDWTLGVNASDVLITNAPFSALTITDQGLTAGRVPIVGTAGLLQDDADITFATDTLTVTKEVIGGGAAITSSGVGGALGALSFITPGTGVTAALAVNVGSAGAPVLFNGAGGTPSSVTLTNGTGLPLSTGVTGTLPAAQEPAHTGDVINSAGSLALSIAAKTGTGSTYATNTSPTFITPVIGAATGTSFAATSFVSVAGTGSASASKGLFQFSGGSTFLNSYGADNSTIGNQLFGNFSANASAGDYFMLLSKVGNLKIGSSGADTLRGTTEGTNQLVLFNGTPPAGTLTNGAAFHVTSGEMKVMDASGNDTLLSPHDLTTNEWIYDSTDTRTGKRLRIDMERMMKTLNATFRWNYVHEPDGSPSTFALTPGDIGGCKVITPTPGATVTITIDATVPRAIAAWTAGEIETINISGTPQDGAHLTLIITNDAGLGRVLTLGTGLSSLGVVTGVISKKSTITFIALSGTFFEISRSVGM